MLIALHPFIHPTARPEKVNVSIVKIPSKRPPGKPRHDFPLFVYQAGYWAKRVRGRTVCFGKVADDLKDAPARPKMDQSPDSP